MTDPTVRRTRAHILVAAVVLFISHARPAHACYPECYAAEERTAGIAMGVGASAMVAILGPLAANDLFPHDRSPPPSYGTIAAIAGGTALVSVAVTALAFAARVPSTSDRVIPDEQPLPEVALWAGPPVVLGTVAAIVANLLLRTPESPPRFTFAVSPIASGATGMVHYTF